MWPKDVTKKDLRVDFYRGSGPGGQNRNKRDTACRITHTPTGLVATAEEHRTQGQNKEAAFKRLADKLVPLMKAAAKTEHTERITDTIRTYHEKRNEVKDHRIKDKTFDYTDILNGKLDQIYKLL